MCTRDSSAKLILPQQFGDAGTTSARGHPAQGQPGSCQCPRPSNTRFSGFGQHEDPCQCPRPHGSHNDHRSKASVRVGLTKPPSCPPPRRACSDRAPNDTPLVPFTWLASSFFTFTLSAASFFRCWRRLAFDQSAGYLPYVGSVTGSWPPGVLLEDCG